MTELEIFAPLQLALPFSGVYYKQRHSTENRNLSTIMQLAVMTLTSTTLAGELCSVHVLSTHSISLYCSSDHLRHIR